MVSAENGIFQQKTHFQLGHRTTWLSQPDKMFDPSQCKWTIALTHQTEVSNDDNSSAP
jgi:hypothetical protein